MKVLRILLNALGLGFLFYKPPYKSPVPPDEPPTLSGKKIKLIKEYPLKAANITRGRTYDIVDQYEVQKQITPYAKIPLDFVSIVNDQGKVVVVTKVYFKDVN